MATVISIGCDHAGYLLKESIRSFLQEHGFEVFDHGTHSADSVDYPDHVHPVASDVESGRANSGILICGSGNGVCMTANKHAGIRAALAWTEEIASLARRHNNANILCLPARFVSVDAAIHMTDVFLHTDFEGGRHLGRIQKMTEF